jgi:hypothetical protein
MQPVELVLDEAVWIRAFEAATGADVPIDQKSAADIWIQQQAIASGTAALAICMSILGQQDNKLGVRRLAAIAAARCLCPGTTADLEVMRKGWMEDRALAQKVKEVLYATIICDDEVIRSEGARCFALVFGLEGRAWGEGLDDIIGSLEGTANGNPTATVGLLAIFREIMFLPNFATDLVYPELLERYKGLVIVALRIMGSPGDVPVPVRSAAAQCVREAIGAIPMLFGGDDEERKTRIEGVLGALPPCMEIPDENLFLCCQRIMYKLVKSFYAVAGDFIGKIFEFNSRFIAMNEAEGGQFLNGAIFLWREIAMYEARLAKKAARLSAEGRVESETKEFFTGKVAPQLFSRLFEIMCNVPEEHREIEDPNERTPSVFAAVAISAFWGTCPEKIFDLILQAWRENYSSPSWPCRHAALLLVYCVSEGEPVRQEAVMYWLRDEVFGVLLAACRDIEVPRIRETGLFVLGRLLGTYKILLSERMYCQDPVRVINEVMSLLVIDTDVPPIVLQRYATLLYNLAGIWPENNLHRPLSGFFGQMIEILVQMINRPIHNQETLSVFSSACESLNFVVMRTTPPDRKERALELLRETMMRLQHSFGMIESDDVRFSIQASLCGTLTSLILVVADILEEHDLNELIRLLFAILQNQNSMIYEEALMTFTALYWRRHQAFTDEQKVRLIEIVDVALRSEQPGVINAGSILIGDMYYHMGTDEFLLARFGSFFQLEFEVLMAHPEMKMIHPFVVKGIARMFEGVHRADEGTRTRVNVIAEFEPHLHGLMQALTRIALDPDNDADVTYANSLFEYVCHLFEMYAKIYHANMDGQTGQTDMNVLSREREQLITMANLAALMANFPELNEYVYVAYMKMTHAYGEHCSRKNNLILQRSVVIKVLNSCVRNPNLKPHLKDKAKKEICFLKCK